MSTSINKINLEDDKDIKYLFEKYISATSKGRSNPRAYRNLVVALSAREIYLELKDTFKNKKD